MRGGMTERAVLLGQRKSLVGVVAQPTTLRSADAPAIVIFNTGIIHRVGHNRMYVTMSRALATAGFTVLRFDFSGIGDSEPRRDGLSPFEACLADIREALDWVEASCQAPRFILIGMCSGADHAILYGPSDPRVAALVLIDPSIPPTARYYLGYVGQRLVRLRSWINVAMGRSRIVRLGAARLLRFASRPQMPGDFGLENLERAYRNSVDRGVSMLAVFTGDSTRQTYRDQMIDAFPNVPFGEQLQLKFFPESDHTFTSSDSRSKLIGTVVGWIQTAAPRMRPAHFGPGARFTSGDLTRER
jgi:pimeloyl-ACP methyl ester carboxylesterase